MQPSSHFHGSEDPLESKGLGGLLIRVARALDATVRLSVFLLSEMCICTSCMRSSAKEECPSRATRGLY